MSKLHFFMQKLLLFMTLCLMSYSLSSYSLVTPDVQFTNNVRIFDDPNLYYHAIAGLPAGYLYPGQVAGTFFYAALDGANTASWEIEIEVEVWSQDNWGTWTSTWKTYDFIVDISTDTDRQLWFRIPLQSNESVAAFPNYNLVHFWAVS